jgi:hypothetical protein
MERNFSYISEPSFFPALAIFDIFTAVQIKFTFLSYENL